MSFLVWLLGVIANFVNSIQFLEYVYRLYKWSKNRFRWRKDSKQARVIAYAFQSFSWANLQQSAPIIAKIGLIERPEILMIREAWESTGTSILLNGDAGTGKSGIALRLAKELADEGIPILFIRATELPRGEDPVSYIQNRMALSIPLVKAISDLSKERTCLLVLDQLDSVSGTDLCKSLVGFLKALTGLTDIKIIAVSRSYEAENDSDISKLSFIPIKSGILTPEQSSSYLLKFGISHPSKKLVELASNLLNLSLIVDLVGLPDFNGENVLNQVNLWEQFFTTIQQREGDETAEYVLHLAREVTAKGDRSFPSSIPSKASQRKLISRRILIELPGKRLAFRHEQLQAFLCAYALLPERPTIAQLVQEFGTNNSKNILFWLHSLYHAQIPGEEPGFVEDVLNSKKLLPFYTRVAIIEGLKSQPDPTAHIAKVLGKQISEGSYNRYFFEGLENPAWFIPLYEAGLFHNTPEPIEVKPGSFQLPFWPAGDYLVRFAGDHPNIVMEQVRSTQTKNIRVHELLIEAMLKIAPESSADLVPYINSWLDAPFSEMLPIKLGELADHLLETGYPQACLQILESVTLPVLPAGIKEISDYLSPLKFRSEHYWVNEFVEKLTPKLNQIIPTGIVDIFSRHLLTAIELIKQLQSEKAEYWVGFSWRLDIPSLKEDSNEAVLDILIDGLRDSLDSLCGQSLEQGYSTLKAFLSSEHLVFQRLALYTLRFHGQKFPDLLEQALLKRDYLNESIYASEYRGLLRNQFATATGECRNIVVSRIMSGPQDLEKRAQNHARWENREATDEDRLDIQERWTLYHLEIIRAQLSGEALAVLNQLTEKFGKPDVEERPHIVTTEWGRTPGPVSPAELANKDFADLKQLFLEFIPVDLFENPRESLAETFRGIVQENPSKYEDFASYLIDPGMRYVYIYNFLEGIRESIKNNTGKLTEAVIRLCEYVVAQKEDLFKASSGHYEPVLSTAQLGVSWLVEQAMQSEDPYLSRELLDRIRAVIIILCHHSDPGPESDENVSGFDAINKSVNCVRGIAMHAIFEYSRYIIRQYNKTNNVNLTRGFLEPEIQALLDEKLDKSNDPSLAVHSVLGEFFPQLHFLSREWAVGNIADIFPERENQIRYWKAAWDAYVFSSRVYGDVFNLLIPQYQRALRLLSRSQNEEKDKVTTSDEALGRHILLAYIAGLTDFGHENQLLDLYFENAPDALRARGVLWLDRGLKANKPKEVDETWGKLWTLWNIRLGVAEAQDTQLNREEISEYTRWVDDAPVGMEVLYPVLKRSAKYFVKGLDVHMVVAFAAKNCREFPLEAVSLLQQCLLNSKEPWWAGDVKYERAILEAALESEIPEAREIGEEVINYHGEQGDFRWKDLLG